MLISKKGLVAHYDFANGSVNDLSGNGNHVNFNNATKVSDRFGKADNAYSFNGSSHFMTVPNSPSLNPTNGITLMAIFKINGFFAGNCLSNQVFGKGWNDFIQGFYIMRFTSLAGCNAPLDPSRVYLVGSYGDLSARGGASDMTKFVQTNKWYNVVYTHGDGISKLYIDGVLINSTSKDVTFTPNSQEMFIGKHGDPQYPYWFNGIIDEVRVYNRAICEGEVKLLNNLSQ